MTTMRAKMRVSAVQKNTATVDNGNVKTGDTLSETLQFHCVAKSDGPYPADGSDENNTFARWSPYGEFKLAVANPALFDRFNVGDEFYVDFTPAA